MYNNENQEVDGENKVKNNISTLNCSSFIGKSICKV